MSQGPRRRLRQLVATVRFRVTALATLAVLAVLTLAGVALIVTQTRLLTGNLDDSLTQRADDLTGLVAQGLPDRLGGSGDETGTQITSLDGQVVAASPNLAGQPAVAPPPRPGSTRSLRTLDSLPPDDERFRLVSQQARSPEGPVIVHVAGSLDDIDESVAVLRTSLWAGVPAVTALLAVLVWWLVGRTLRPVEAIRAEVAGIGGSALGRRVPEPPGGDEIARLARTMNAMLGRVEDAAERQRRFVADASHELRSPLTRIRSEVEVDLSHPGSADLAATHRSVLEEATALHRLVEDLLHLARSDAGAGDLRWEPVDLDEVVMDHVRRLRGSGQSVDSSGVGAAQVRGDAAQLSRALGNLADNAARHAAGVVTFSLGERDGSAVLAVTDDGPGIPAEQQERVFERFARVDEARGSATGGTGLGLAIVRDIVGRHGGSVMIDGGHHPGARFVVTLPLGNGYTPPAG